MIVDRIVEVNRWLYPPLPLTALVLFVVAYLVSRRHPTSSPWPIITQRRDLEAEVRTWSLDDHETEVRWLGYPALSKREIVATAGERCWFYRGQDIHAEGWPLYFIRDEAAAGALEAEEAHRAEMQERIAVPGGPDDPGGHPGARARRPAGPRPPVPAMLASGGGMRMGWRNWTGNQATDPTRTVVARDAGDVVDAVCAAARDGLRVKALGSGHSFAAISVPDGVALVSPSDPARVRVDDDGLVTVPAGLTLRRLNGVLWEHGLALPNLGDIDAQTVAGAISTGTHGTGARHPGLAAQVRACEIVLADGSVLACSPDENAELFAAVRVGLGALGILVNVTLQVVPAFRLHAVESAKPLGEILDGFDALAEAHDHVEFYWFPHTDIAATKVDDRTDATAPVRGRAAEWLGDELLGNGAFALACRVGEAVPRLVPAINRFAAGQFAGADYVDRSYRVFTSPRRVRFLEMEYAVPRAALGEAFDGLRAAAGRHARGVTFPVEVRVAAADDIPLSTASGRDSAYLAVHVHRGQPHEAYFGAVEAVMTSLGGRPHWGKLHTRTAAQLREVYPGFDAFVALRDRLDPERRFSNAYLERVLG